MVLKLTIWVQIICTALTAHPAATIYMSSSLNVIMNFLKYHRITLAETLVIGVFK